MTEASDTPEIQRPGTDEYDRYYDGYVERVVSDDILAVLQRQREDTLAFISTIGEDRGDSRYEAGKWSVKEVFGHLVDVERVFTARALWFARGQTSPLPDMDADSFVKAARFDRRTLADLADDYGAARTSTIAFFRSMSQPDLTRRGVAAGCQFTVRAIAFILAGHERHHLDILVQRYRLKKIS